MVYDGTGSGINNSLWCPSFFLTNIDSVLRVVGLESLFGDNE